MATQLSLYNGALVKYLGERKLGSLTENRKPRRVLDTIWDDDFVDGVLEDAFWNFATRSFRSEYNSSVNPDFGYEYAHDKPSDWIRTAAVAFDEYLNDPINSYNDETDYLFTHYETIYMSIVSNGNDYGGDLTKWPQSVVDYAEMKLAWHACMAITKDKAMASDLQAKADRQLKIAKGRDAMNSPAKFPPTGSWVRARRTGRWQPPTNIRTI